MHLSIFIQIKTCFMRNLFTVLAIFITTISTAQYTKEDAKADLQRLKEGTLLVRLRTNEASIAALESQGRKKEAEKMKEALYRENKEILLSFTQTFDFCRVYFFYAPSSDNIRDKDFEGHVFDVNLRPVPADSIGSNIYTAEFSETENLGIKGLIVMDDNLFPLKSPFPFYQKKVYCTGHNSALQG